MQAKQACGPACCTRTEWGGTMGLLQSLWKSGKQWRAIPVGPVSIIYRVGRTTRVSSNIRRRLLRTVRGRPWPPASRSPQPGRCHTQVETGCFVQAIPPRSETALIVGVGPGLGFALARGLVSSGLNVALASRNAERLDPLVSELRSMSMGTIRAYGCDATSEISVRRLMAYVSSDIQVPDLVIYSAQGFGP